MLDLYLPPDEDHRDARPAMVYIHGGSFIGGDKGQGDIVYFAHELATRGLVVVSINYRLTAGYYSWESEQYIYDAVEDARAAVRFLRRYASEYHIDTDRIMVMGESAGAVTSLSYGYVKTGQYEGNSGNPGYSSYANAIGSVSGEIKSQAFCKSVHPEPHGCRVNFDDDRTNDITGIKQPPMLIVHGEEDKTIPFVNGKEAYDRAQSVGLLSQLIDIPHAGHVPWGSILEEPYRRQLIEGIITDLDLANAEAPEGCTKSTYEFLQ